MNESPFDHTIDALADEHRRRLLLDLRADSPREDTPTADRTGPGTDELAVELVHVHLPKLDAYGFVEWDRRTGTVYRGRHFEELSPLLELLEGVEGVEGSEGDEAEPPTEEV